MATSRTHGTSSSSQATRKALAQKLGEIAESAPVTLIHKALGIDDELYLVGGIVRDLASGLEQSDLDLATGLEAGTIISRLKANSIRVVETGLQHGTVTAVIDAKGYEISSFRRLASGAIADSIETDLLGRDFTINALAFAVSSKTLLDPFGGLNDLDNSLLRAVENPMHRFAEDPHRIMRMVRFGPAQGRTIHEDTLAAAKSVRPRLAEVAVERTRVELEKILVSSHAADGFRCLKELNLLEHTVPELLTCVGFEQNEFHIHDVFEHILWVMERCPHDLKLRLTALFHDIGKPQSLSVGDDGRRHFFKHESFGAEICKERMAQLKFSHHLTEQVTLLVQHHMRPVDCGPVGIRRLLRDLGEEFESWRKFKYADATPTIADDVVRERLADFDHRVEVERERLAKMGGSNLAIDGNDLIALGMRPGIQLGAVLKALNEDIIVDPELNTREVLLARAKLKIDAL